MKTHDANTPVSHVLKRGRAGREDNSFLGGSD